MAVINKAFIVILLSSDFCSIRPPLFLFSTYKLHDDVTACKKCPFHPFPKFALKLDSQNPFIPPHKAFPSLLVVVINMRRKVGRGTPPVGEPD